MSGSPPLLALVYLSVSPSVRIVSLIDHDSYQL